jgi:hypothetical protein
LKPPQQGQFVGRGNRAPLHAARHNAAQSFFLDGWDNLGSRLSIASFKSRR